MKKRTTRAKGRQEKPTPVYVVSYFGDGYGVSNPQTGNRIDEGSLPLEEATQLCRDKGLEFVVDDPFRKNLGEIFDAPKRPKTLPQITHVELFQAACQIASINYMRILASGDKGTDQDPLSYLPQAHASLLETAAYLEGFQKTQTTYTFDQILSGKQAPQPQQPGGSKTAAKGITTRGGLIKAIRREMPFPQNEVIILRGSMTQLELEILFQRITESHSRIGRTNRMGSRSQSKA